MKREPILAAVISDTHGLLRPEVEQVIASCDVVIHAGDFDNQMLYHKLNISQPLYGVKGNNDGYWAGQLPVVRRFELSKVKFIMAHQRSDIPKTLEEEQVVIYGHSHLYDQQMEEGRLWLNPGSCGYKRFTLPLSLAVMTLYEGNYEVKTIWLEEEYGREPWKQRERDQLFLIAKIMRFMKRGEKISWVADNLKAEPAFVETIYRICAAHPGADAHQILDKYI